MLQAEFWSLCVASIYQWQKWRAMDGAQTIDRKTIGRRLLVEKTIGRKDYWSKRQIGRNFLILRWKNGRTNGLRIFDANASSFEERI